MTRKPLREVVGWELRESRWPLAMRRKVLESCNSRLSLKTVSWRSPRRESFFSAVGRIPAVFRYYIKVNCGQIMAENKEVAEVTTTINGIITLIMTGWGLLFIHVTSSFFGKKVD